MTRRFCLAVIVSLLLAYPAQSQTGLRAVVHATGFSAPVAIVQDPTPAKLHDDVHERFKDGKPCHDDESDHKRRSHDDPEEKSSHHKKSDDGDSDDNDSSDSDSSDSKADDDSDDDDDTTSTQVKVVPKGSVDTGDGSSL